MKKHPDRTHVEYLEKRLTLHKQILKVEQWRIEALENDVREAKEQTTLFDTT